MEREVPNAISRVHIELPFVEVNNPDMKTQVTSLSREAHNLSASQFARL
jgi:hypothetical protein